MDKQTEEEKKIRKRKAQVKYKKTAKGKITEHLYRISNKNKLYNKKYRENNKKMAKAHGIFKQAIVDKTIIRGNCVICGSPNALGHHDDYNKPLDVIWLCPKHHSSFRNRIYWEVIKEWHNKI